MKKILPMLKIIIPVLLAVVLLQVANVPESQAAPPAGGGVYHTVQYGETLFSIGRLYGIYPYKIAEVNDLANPNCIYAGQVLYIPASDGWSDCGNCGCGNTCPSPRPQPCRYPGCQYPTYGHGYDYSGYYYYNTYPTYRRYSYTCGYYHNCY